MIFKNFIPVIITILFLIGSNELKAQTNTTLKPRGTLIILPEIERYSFTQKDNIIITDTLSYFEIFRDHPRTDLPVINFSQNYLLGIYSCSYCLKCPSDQQQCHRAACSYRLKWFLMEND